MNDVSNLSKTTQFKGSQYTEEDNVEANSSFALKLLFFHRANANTCSLPKGFAFAI